MGILDIVFPKTCLECGREGVYICPNCLAKVRLAKPICPVCEKASIDGLTHVICSKKLGLDGLISIWEYEGVIRRAILALKFKYSTEVGKELSARFLAYTNNFFLPKAEVLVPIPIFWYRENKRGFNQSSEVGKHVASFVKVGFEPNLLARSKSSKPQVELSGEARRENLKGVFSLNPNIKMPDSIMLFDDVFTTGSTLKEAAKVLKRAGVSKVWGLTIAR